MKKKYCIPVVIALLGAAVCVGVYLSPRQLPLSQCSELYRQYSGDSHIRASFIKDFRVNDSLALDVTVLEALDSAGWDTLVCRYFFVPLPGYEKPDFESKDRETSRLAPRDDISLPTDTVFENNVLLILSNEKRSLFVFHTGSRDEIATIMMMRFKSLKIKKNLYL